MTNAILVFNSGSSSVKFSVFGIGENSLDVIIKGQIDGIGTGHTKFIGKDADNNKVAEEEITHLKEFSLLFAHLLEWIESHDSGAKIVAAGHRVVHGGKEFSKPVLITPEIIEQLEGLTPLAPLHQPYNVEPIKVIEQLYPHLPQVACFDTAFHRTQDKLSETYPIARELTEEGIIRYGFHGLSYEYIANLLPYIAPQKAKGRTVIGHLGNGASMCAMKDCKSVATTMGFTALEGVMMGTRCGTIDPGIILYLLEVKKMSVAEVSHALYYDSGLKGVSGIGNDMRDLTESDDPHAKEAVDLFAYRIARELGSLTQAIEGLDTLIFTAGIGERSPEIREAVCSRSSWMGVDLDDEANNNNELFITTPESPIAVAVIPTNEELMIAIHVGEVVDIEGYHLSKDAIFAEIGK